MSDITLAAKQTGLPAVLWRRRFKDEYEDAGRQQQLRPFLYVRRRSTAITPVPLTNSFSYKRVSPMHLFCMRTSRDDTRAGRSDDGFPAACCSQPPLPDHPNCHPFHTRFKPHQEKYWSTQCATRKHDQLAFNRRDPCFPEALPIDVQGRLHVATRIKVTTMHAHLARFLNKNITLINAKELEMSSYS